MLYCDLFRGLFSFFWIDLIWNPLLISIRIPSVLQKLSFKRYEISCVYRRAVGHSTPNRYIQVHGIHNRIHIFSWISFIVLVKHFLYHEGCSDKIWHSYVKQRCFQVKSEVWYLHAILWINNLLCNQGDFDIIGGAPALTEAETIKVFLCLFIFAFCLEFCCTGWCFL